MLPLLILLFASLFFPNNAQFQFVASGHRNVLADAKDQGAVDKPSIFYLEWLGNSLLVSGYGLQDGATILINGQAMKTKNAGLILLISKKARKRIPKAQEIVIQVENPNGERSDEVPFYSGITIGWDTGHEPIHLHTGDVFLLYLSVGDPQAFKWSVYATGPDPTILAQLSEPQPIPGSQGFFQVTNTGQFQLNALGSPQCPPQPIERCTISGAYLQPFAATIIVE